MLMHPLEIKRKIRTGHLCQNILNKVEIIVNRKLKKHVGSNAPLDAALADPESTVILFPANDAVDLSDVAGARERGELPATVKHLIVFDGTCKLL
jgi:DTW domain-containing protein YfiP